MRQRLVVAVLAVALAAVARDARADVTVFLGGNTTPSTRLVRGAAIGAGVLVVGIEFEYANTTQDAPDNAPGLTTGMFNLLLQTPFPIAGFQPYVTAGGGLYRETLLSNSETSFGSNGGGGVKVTLAGPIRARFDYRVFRLSGSPLHRRPHRFYAGLNFAF